MKRRFFSTSIIALGLLMVFGIIEMRQTALAPQLPLPEETVLQYMRATLGSLPGAVYDEAAAKALLSPELQVQFADSAFVPQSYGIQDGPDRAEIAASAVRGSTAEVTARGYFGDAHREWTFRLAWQEGRWQITAIAPL